MEKTDLHPRAARYRAARLRDALAHLRVARMELDRLGHDTGAVDSQLHELDIELRRLLARAGDRIEARHRPRKTSPIGTVPPSWLFFLDECGSPATTITTSAFPVFCLSGVLISRDAYDAIDTRWKAWKQEYLGSSDVCVHEPDVRHGTSRFQGDSPEHRQEIENSMNGILDEFDVVSIAAVIDLKAFEMEHPGAFVNDFLPRSSYFVAMNFLMERAVHFVHAHDGERVYVVAESRGLKEDAQLQAEFVRLHLEGTQFISASAFRTWLGPHIEFRRKRRNSTGLQIADLAARPFAEKVLRLSPDPARWQLMRRKLYDGGKGAPHSYGLKVFPALSENDPFSDIKG